MQFRPRPAASADKNTYIPPSVQQSMNQQLQQNVPAHLKKYVGTGAYVPQHAQKALRQHMEKTSAGHLKQYAGAFVEQNVVQPGLNGPVAGAVTAPASRAPVPNQLRLDHSADTGGSQHEAQFTELFQSDQQNQQSAQPIQPPPPPDPTADQSPPPQQQPYDFILNPEQPKSEFKLPGGDNKAVQIGLVVVGLILIFILVGIFKNIISPPANFTPYITIAQDQQQLLHLAQGAAEQQDISTVNKNYTYTAQMSLKTSQANVISYLASNKKKVNKKTLGLKVKTALDQQLVASQAAGTYNQTLHDITESQLKIYISHLNAAYQKSTGKKGRALIKDNLAQAQLLLKQLNAPSS